VTLHLRAVRPLGSAADAPDVGAQAGDSATTRRIVAVRGRDVPIRERAQRILSPGDGLLQLGFALGQRMLDGLVDQLVAMSSTTSAGRSKRA
jgi:hypothetical protein